MQRVNTSSLIKISCKSVRVSYINDFVFIVLAYTEWHYSCIKIMYRITVWPILVLQAPLVST